MDNAKDLLVARLIGLILCCLMLGGIGGFLIGRYTGISTNVMAGLFLGMSLFVSYQTGKLIKRD